jgi:simple sugar transport system permease protein
VDIYGAQGSPTDVPSVGSPSFHFLSHIPDVSIGPVEFGGTFLDSVFGDLNYMIWLSFIVLILTYIVLFRTTLGLRIRAVGEHPRAADTVGINVYGLRYFSVILSGMLAAAGGAYLTVGFLGTYNENVTAGRGFIALAALIFGNWRPFGAFGAALLFGLSTAIAYRLPVYSETAATLFQALPYVITLIAVAGVIGRSTPPAAVGRPYVKQ